MRNRLSYNPMISALIRPCEAGLQSCFSRSVSRYKVACTTLEGVVQVVHTHTQKRKIKKTGKTEKGRKP